MAYMDTYHVYLRELDPSAVQWHIADAEVPDSHRRRVLDLNDSIQLYIRPDDGHAPKTITALRVFAAAALEVADSLEAARPRSRRRPPSSPRSSDSDRGPVVAGDAAAGLR